MAERPSPQTIRALRAENPKARARDFAQTHGITEAELVAAYAGAHVTVIDATPDRLIPMVCQLGDVLALTRNESCVHERVGTYQDYHAGPMAQMVLGAEIDLRIFPSHWVHGFAVAEPGADGAVKRSVQVFDAAGDAIHKVHLRAESDVAAFDALVEALRLPDQSGALTLTPRAAVEPAKADPAKADALRAEWDGMTDTHQFLRMIRKFKMNRLGAYRVVGAPKARPLAVDAVTQLLHRASDQKVPVMIFVGNMGCIQIHGGPVDRIVPMGPWINVLDPRFDMHLRTDHIAEVWAVTKPTRTGDAISVEAFDAEGGLILQIFGYRKDTPAEPWNALVAGLPVAEEVLA
ncbi:hemin-degrading factor [Gemmobacter sp.]|uniref:hemin-degrading factor n=1 Tax=Gemmobacter sp. TaxID=1898957 RepID=UPI002AFFDFC5|nr:ChuX/HutX family heme-like substrate-binding protein [Gemmobacter sp.]